MRIHYSERLLLGKGELCGSMGDSRGGGLVCDKL